jgi:hypothetical protein
MITLNNTPVIVSGLCIRELGDAVIIITENGDELHSLDELGSFIWRAVDGVSSVQNILDKICNEYEVDRSQAEEDLKKFLSALKDKNLIGI